jgi:hypothetical protein
VKLFPTARLIMCALFVTGFSSVGAPNANAVEGRAVLSSAAAQDTPRESGAAPNLSGNWQMSWTTEKGKQRQVTIEIKQQGNKLSGNFESERGSASLKGTLQGDQVSFSVKMPRRQASFTGKVDGNKMSGTTEQGAPWIATRQ